MDVKYLSDDKGKITGVFLSIEDWEQLQKQYSISLDAAGAPSAQLQNGLSAALAKAKPGAAGNE
ncbi:hypothetical protein [Hymenobacter nivis]|uniref:Uncharacterized protein n=1 Tax=Hymenobacter nivis TaxID=1850093 RepID=A0A502HFU0_9BACT|nr:hypothetical protein [Hymenobacter nivis]TPG72226.1 hypothetical protein EAH73_03065 [Hymenobacter nivis]